MLAAPEEPISEWITSLGHRLRRLKSSAVSHNCHRANGHISAGNGYLNYCKVKFEGNLFFNQTGKKKNIKIHKPFYFLDGNNTFMKPVQVAVC